MSGISCDESCIEAFNLFKLQNSRKNGEKHRYILYSIKDEKIVISKKADQDKTWDDFCEDLVEGNCGAYGIFDLHHEKEDGRSVDKIVFVQWAPDSLRVKEKMLYGATCESFKGELGSGLSLVIQASGIDDLDYADVIKKI